MSAAARSAGRPGIETLDHAGLVALEPEWADLWRRCGATPFQHPAWLLPWARHHAPGRAMAAALRVGGALHGLAPVFAWEGALLLAGTGPSDRGDWLLAPGGVPHAVDLLAAIAALCPESDRRVVLRQLPPGSALHTTPAPPGWVEEFAGDEPCHVAPLSGSGGLGAASRSCRSNWRYAMRRIGREGGTVELTPAGEASAAMEDLARLHALRWRARGEGGVLSAPLLGAFLSDAVPALASAGLLRLWRLRFGQDTAAALLVLAGKGAHHYYIGGFDPAAARLGPSAVLVGAAMAGAAHEGAAAFDFLRGAEPYKARWGAVQDPTLRRTLMRAG